MNRGSPHRLLVPFFTLLLMASAMHGAAGQAVTAQALRQEAQQARDDAAKQRALADDYRDQAQKLQMRAASELQQASDARQNGKTDAARQFEQQAKSDNDEADRRLDTATRFDRETERLLMVAADKDRAADRLAQDEPAKDTPTALWQQARSTLHDALYALATTRARLASMLGQEYDAGVHKYATFRQDKLDSIFDRYKETQDSLDDAETAWRDYRSKKIDANKFADSCYRSLDDALVRLTHMEFRAAGMEVQILSARAGRGNDADDQLYDTGRAGIDAQYSSGAIDINQKDAELAELARKAGKSRHAHFDEIAPPYRIIMLRLARFRRDWSAVVK